MNTGKNSHPPVTALRASSVPASPCTTVSSVRFVTQIHNWGTDV
jgi:hypothetical protein